MTRWIWIVRVLGILMLLGFFILLASLQRRLVEMQGGRPPATATSGSTP